MKITSAFVTARKRSLGQGNIFTPICHSVHRGVPARGGACSRGVPGRDPPRTVTAAGGTHPTGMHSCFWIYLVNYEFGELQNLCSGRKFPSYHCTFISEELRRIEERKIIMIYSCKILKNRLE